MSIPAPKSNGGGTEYSYLYNRLQVAGYTINGLTRIFGQSHKLVQRTLLRHPQDLSVRQAYIIAGLLGCHVIEVLELVCGRAPVGPVAKVDPYTKAKQLPEGFSEKGLKEGKIPAPGWLRK